MRLKFNWMLFFCLFSLAGCSKYYLSLRQVPVDGQYLASSSVGSPDPRQLNPPFGQKIVMEWAVPPGILKEEPCLVLHVLYRNYTEEKLIYPIKSRVGMKVFSLLNEVYTSRGGLLSYQAEIRTKAGQLYRQWTHQLWVQLITLKEESSSKEERTSDSVSSQPTHASVTETP